MGNNKKLREEIKRELIEDLGLEEVKHYFEEPSFKRESDYNIVQYGNLLIYYDDVRDLFKECGYAVKWYSDDKLWESYKRLVGSITRELMRGVI